MMMNYAGADVASLPGPAYHNMQSNPIQGNTQQEQNNKHAKLPLTNTQKLPTSTASKRRTLEHRTWQLTLSALHQTDSTYVHVCIQ